MLTDFNQLVEMLSNKQYLETFPKFSMLLFVLLAYVKRFKQLAHQNKTPKFPHNCKFSIHVHNILKRKS